MQQTVLLQNGFQEAFRAILTQFLHHLAVISIGYEQKSVQNCSRPIVMNSVL